MCFIQFIPFHKPMYRKVMPFTQGHQAVSCRTGFMLGRPTSAFPQGLGTMIGSSFSLQDQTMKLQDLKEVSPSSLVT